MAEQLADCPFCGHHANPIKEEWGQSWGKYVHVITCSSSHCGVAMRIVADGWFEQLDPEFNAHKPPEMLYDDRKLNLIRMWNRRQRTPPAIPSKVIEMVVSALSFYRGRESVGILKRHKITKAAEVLAALAPYREGK